jgi:drug/metabolite transporter (DMT)-like permease
VLGFGVGCVSTAAVLIRLADAPPLAIAAWRMTLASAIVVPLAGSHQPARAAVPSPSDRRRALMAGAALAVHFALWITSLQLTSVASSVVLVTTNPLWVGLAAPFLLGEMPGAAMWSGIVTAFAGGAVIAWNDASGGQHALSGDLLALGGAIAAASYFLLGRRVRAHLGLLEYVAVVYTTAALCLVAAAVAAGVPLLGYPSRTWLCFAALAVVPQVLGHSSFNWALEHLSATMVAVAILGEAVGSVALARWILGERPSPATLFGACLVLLGLAMAVVGEARRDRIPDVAAIDVPP